MASLPLHLLACPVCHAALAAPEPDCIRCSGCGRQYPLRDGIPVLIADRSNTR